jgi:hypothetical protein
LETQLEEFPHQEDEMKNFSFSIGDPFDKMEEYFIDQLTDSEIDYRYTVD